MNAGLRTLGAVGLISTFASGALAADSDAVNNAAPTWLLPADAPAAAPNRRFSAISRCLRLAIRARRC